MALGWAMEGGISSLSFKFCEEQSRACNYYIACLDEEYFFIVAPCSLLCCGWVDSP